VLAVTAVETPPVRTPQDAVAAEPPTPSPAPPIGLGGPTTAAWREEALTRVSELGGLADWIEAAGDGQAGELKLISGVRLQLERARKTAAGEDDTRRRAKWRLVTRLKSSSGGSSVERTLGSLDAAEADLLRLAPAHYLRGLMPSLQAHVNRYLPKSDPRRRRLDALAAKAEQGPLEDSDRSAVVAAYHAANSQRRREILRLRSFRNVLLFAALGLLVVAVGLGVMGSLRPHLIPLCFNPAPKIVCPTHEMTVPKGETVDQAIQATVSGWDIWLVETIGLVAAALAGAFALRGIRGTSTPYSLPVALAVLKLSTGALTAVLGILLMRGGFVPGLSALDTSAQILAWAILFGYAQQLFTRMVDQQAQSVLNDVGGRGAAGERDLQRAG
jgi:hypothetical protein